MRLFLLSFNTYHWFILPNLNLAGFLRGLRQDMKLNDYNISNEIGDCPWQI